MEDVADFGRQSGAGFGSEELIDSGGGSNVVTG